MSWIQTVILVRPWKTQTSMSEINLDGGSCQMTIFAVNGSQLVTFVATFPGDKRDRFASSSGN